ncbi:MAG: hypothetical protein CVV25_11755 [Ignavibacteriae bacterium HGW-Ignavibacteriae-4]|jgi:hypothetical protein|nr:MAG: hypothetical protein CVV25_11755 [Ignavibacteriae bacterium HGW-Ignavibacteriae-4]
MEQFMNFYRRHLVKLNTLIFLLLLSGLTYTAIAWSAGKTGQTQDGCTCHGSANTSTKVTLTSGSGSFTFDPGSTTTFTVAIDNSSMSKAGMNVGVKSTETGGSNIGTLTAGSGTKIESGEVTHNGEQSLNSGKFDFTFDWKAPATHGEYWIRGVANAVNDNGGDSGDQWNRFTTQKITVAGVTVTAPNGGENWCAGTTQTITWKSDGVENVKLEYSTNGGSNWNVISASTQASTGSFSWTIPQGITPGTTNQIRISDAVKTTRNDLSNNSFTIVGEVSIATQPIADETCTGQSFTMTVVVTGTGHQYQWRKNGNPVNGATQATYSRSSALLDDAGDYDCQITTACGVLLTSVKAKLDVFQAPKIATQPTGKFGCEGSSVTLSAVVEGEFTSIQWRKNGQPINGATNSTFVINSLKASDEGDYTLLVKSDKCGNEITSSIAKVALNKEPKFVVQPKPLKGCEGSEIKLTAQVDGTITGFQWYRNDIKVSNATSRDYTIAIAKASDAGNYKLELIGSCGTNQFSDVVKLSINSSPIVVTHPSNKEVFVDESVTLSISAENPGGEVSELTYQWKKNGNNIANANSSTFTLNKVTLADAGKYSVEIKNTCDLSITSNEAEVKVLENNGGPAITANMEVIDLGSVNIGENKSETFVGIITNSGDESLVIAGIKIEGANANAYSLVSITFPIHIAPNSKLDLGILFSPQKAGFNQATISFVSNSVNDVNIELRGNGIDKGTLISSVKSLSFGSAVIDEVVERSFEIENPTNKTITISEMNSSSNDFKFTVITDPIFDPKTKKEIVVTFTPTKEEDYNEVLTISTDDGNTIEIQMTAKGIKSSVWDGIPTITSVKSFPNPGESNITLEMNFDEVIDYQISLVNLSGIVIREFEGYSNIGNNRVIWDSRDATNTKVASGTYFAIIKVEDRIQTISIIVQ